MINCETYEFIENVDLNKENCFFVNNEKIINKNNFNVNNKEKILLIPFEINEKIEINENNIKNKLLNQIETKEIFTNYLKNQKNLLLNLNEKFLNSKKKFEEFYYLILEKKLEKNIEISKKKFIQAEKILNKINTENFLKLFPLFKNEIENYHIEFKYLIKNYEKDININLNKEFDLKYEKLKEEFYLNFSTLKRIFENNLNNKNEKYLYLNNLYKQINNEFNILNIPFILNENENEFYEEINFNLIYEKFFNFIINIINNLIEIEENRRKKIVYYNNEILHKIFLIYKEIKIKDFNIEIKNFNNYSNILNSHLNDFYNSLFNNNINLPLCSQQNEINDCLKNIFNNLKYESFFNNNLNTFELLQILNEKTQNDFNLDLNQSNTSINLENFNTNNNNKSFVNLNNNAIDKIINKYEDKLYFYESLFNFIENYLIQAKMKKLLKNLNKENPKSLGIIIEYICKENFCLKNKINKLINI